MSRPTTRPGTTPDEQKLYDAIVIRDGGQCQLRYPNICLGKATTADHIKPVSKGGQSRADNLRAACQPCNEHRGDNDDPVTDSDHWSRPWL